MIWKWVQEHFILLLHYVHWEQVLGKQHMFNLQGDLQMEDMGKNPNRLQHYYQFQVIIKPSPDEIKKIFLKSLSTIGINYREHDIRFVEDDWESPTLGAAGRGWEVWCDGMEITQFTYFQQMAGMECNPVSVELTYGLERICMFTQGKNNVFELTWNNDGIKYRDIFHQAEKEYSTYNFELANTDSLLKNFELAESECKALLEKKTYITSL